jgi:predicted nucleic acid-binding protein
MKLSREGQKLSGLADFQKANWIKIVPPDQKHDQLLLSLLDAGEAAVISLALKEKAPSSSSTNAKPVSILVEAKKKNLLPEIASQFEKLRLKGYWIHDSITDLALREAGEK